MILPLLLTAAALPDMTYRFASFATPEPEAAAKFLARYTGGRALHRSEFLAFGGDAPSTRLAGVRLPYANGKAFSDVYFRWDAAADGADAASSFSAALAAQHTFAQDDWSWWQDWHLAFTTEAHQIDAIAARLLKDGVPFVNRGSLYFQLPGGLTVQVLGDPTVYWTEPFLFCRETTDATTGKMVPYPTNVTDVDTLPPAPLPELTPSHQSYATTMAAANEKWTLAMLAFASTDLSNTTAAGGSHAFAGGTCADIRWMHTAAYWSVHYVEQYKKREGGLGVGAHERAVAALRAKHAAKFDDAYAGTRTGFSVASVAPFRAAFDAARQPYVASSGRLLVSAPNGQLFELFEEAPTAERFDAAAARAAVAASRRCAPNERDVKCR